MSLATILLNVVEDLKRHDAYLEAYLQVKFKFAYRLGLGLRNVQKIKHFEI